VIQMLLSWTMGIAVISTPCVLAGFSLGNTVAAHTKGIWVWPRPHPLDDGRFLVLLDTEGIGDVRKVRRQGGLQGEREDCRARREVRAGGRGGTGREVEGGCE
jgi:hypothetical protein